MANQFEYLPTGRLEELKFVYEGYRTLYAKILKTKGLSPRTRKIVVEKALRSEDRLTQINTALIVAKHKKQHGI